MEDKMIQCLPDELKQQIAVKVNLLYLLDPSADNTILRIVEILEGYGLKPVVSDIRYYGPCKELKCKGSVDLLTAEMIYKQFEDVIHSIINYDADEGFTLTE